MSEDNTIEITAQSNVQVEDMGGLTPTVTDDEAEAYFEALAAEQEAQAAQVVTENPIQAPAVQSGISGAPGSGMAVVLKNERGEIDLSQYRDPIEKMEALFSIYPPEKYNLINFTEYLMVKIPEGVTFSPVIVQIHETELWDSNNSSIGIKPGYVEPSAQAISKLAKAADIKFRRTRREEIEIGKKMHLEMEFEAAMRLPDNSIVTATGSKALPLYTNSGSLQAHITENVQMKAERNAAKKLLNIPTTMPVAQSKRPFIVLKVNYDPAVEESRKLLGERQSDAERAKRLLYPADMTIDVKVQQDMDDFKLRIQGAQDLPELNQIGYDISQALMTGEQRNELLAAFKARKSLLENVAANQAPTV